MIVCTHATVGATIGRPPEIVHNFQIFDGNR